MKRIISITLALIISLTLVPVAALSAPDLEVSVILDGRQLTFDAPPQIINGRATVPMRTIFEAMGAKVKWNNDTKTVTAASADNSIEVVLTIGSTSPTINGETVTIDQPGYIENSKTMAPLRFVCEAFGGNVEWHDADKTAVVTSKPGVPVPRPPMPLPEFPEIDGSSSTELMHAAIRAHVIDEYYVFSHSQTYAALERLVPGSANPADVLLSVKYYDETLDDVKSRGADLVITPVAKEGFVFIVNANNPIDSLTQQQVRDIYTGKITNWKEVGGNDESIQRLTRNANSGSQTAMENFMGGSPIDEGFGLTIDIMGSMGDMLNAVSAVLFTGSSAIGYNIFSWVMEQDMSYYSNIKLLAVDGVKPSNETLADDSYPLRVYTYSYYNNGNTIGKNFTDWLLTAEGQKVIASAGYVGIFGELPPEEHLGYDHFNRDADDSRAVIRDFYTKHKLISSRDGTIRRGYSDIKRINDKIQTQALANGKGKDLTELYLFRGDGIDDYSNGIVYKYIRFIVLTREKGGAFEVINEGEVLSFNNGVITTSGVDSHIERFPIEADYYTSVLLDEQPDAFRGYIPDFAALGLTVSEYYGTGILSLKNGIPYLLKFFIEMSGNDHFVWHVSPSEDQFDFLTRDTQGQGELKGLTKRAVYDAIDYGHSIVFTWDGLFFAIQSWNKEEVWKVIQHMQRM